MASEIGEFLRSRRARISPQQAGLPQGVTRRRVSGLRREEVAQLAGVSVDYYVHLEQGRATQVSEPILDAVSRVLGLSVAEREHLGNLARPRRSTARPPSHPVSVHLRQLLELMRDVPALVIGRRMEILAWNRPAEAVFGMTATSAAGRGAAYAFFVDHAVSDLYLNRTAIGSEIVGHLRLETGRYPDDPKLAALIGELSMRSEEFRRLWAKNDVKQKTGGITRLAHPLVGVLDFDYGVQQVADDPSQSLIAYSYAPDSPTAERMQLLLGWNIEPKTSAERRQASAGPRPGSDEPRHQHTGTAHSGR